MKFSLKLLESDSEISKRILDEMRLKIEKAINTSISGISNEIKILIGDALRNQPEYTSLVAGTLKAELGIADNSSVVNVINALIETLSVKNNGVKVSAKGLSGGFVLTMMKSDDMNGVIFSEAANVVDSKGYSLPWLEWLLLKGNEIIVKNYSVKYGSFGYSRSGMAIMTPSSDSWRVPPQFSGTEKDNWTTRAINSVETSVYKIIQTNIEKHI